MYAHILHKNKEYIGTCHSRKFCFTISTTKFIDKTKSKSKKLLFFCCTLPTTATTALKHMKIKNNKNKNKHIYMYIT